MDGSAPDQPTLAPPHALDAEAAVLSALFLGATVEIEPEHFYSDANRLIFEAIRATEPADVVSVADYMRREKTMHRAGGAAYLGQIVDATPAVANVAAHARIVRECWRRRRLIAALQQVTAELYEGLGASEAWLRVKDECAR